MLAKLKTDPEDFIRDMFVKYDTNFDGVLSWTEFVNLQNACLDDALGRRKPEAPLKTSSSKGGTVDARKKLAAEKAATKAAEAARIHKQNQEMKARILAQGKGRDPKALDADIERQRRALAQARADAKAAEKARLDAENRTLATRRRNTQAKVDDDITDEAAGFARVEMAEASRAWKDQESERLARENAEYHSRIANTVSKTDDDITDDVDPETGVVGAGRAEAAAASRERKAAEAQRLARENSAMRQRIQNTVARTDDDITDDIAADGTVGAGRAEAAEASRARKQAETAAISADNDAMRKRIANAAARTVDELS